MCKILFSSNCKKKLCQVFTFLLKTESWLWKKLDWSKVTVICYAGWVDEELTRFAHQRNVTGLWSQLLSENDKKEIFSVVFIANYPKHQLLNTTYRKEWIDQQVDYALSHNLGIYPDLSSVFVKQQLN